MAGFLYYLPKETRLVPADRLPALGLQHAFERAPTASECFAGPDGDRGVILADAQRVPSRQIGYYPEVQRWSKIADSPAGAWLGTYKMEAPGPKDLERAKMITGPEVELGGLRWTIPLVRRWYAGDDGNVGWAAAVPQGVKREGGHWTVGEVLPPYRHLYQIAVSWFEARWSAFTGLALSAEGPTFDGTARITLDFDGIWDAVLALLAANYVIGPAEVEQLGLLDTQAARPILDAASDWATFMDWSKKNIGPAGSPTGSDTKAGSPEDCPVTGQP